MEQNGRNDSSINIYDDIINSMAEKLRVAATPHGSPHPYSKCSIYRVPETLRQGNENKYEPCMVSIGPYHRDKQNMVIDEKHKRQYLHCLLSLFRESESMLENILKAVKDQEKEARECYAEEINLSSEDFVMMMVVDGCFILGLLLKNAGGPKLLDARNQMFHVPNTLKHDLLLLENQLPFDVLKCMFELIKVKSSFVSLKGLIVDFFSPLLYSPPGLDSEPDSIEGSHILDYLRNNILCDSIRPDSSNEFSLYYRGDYSVKELMDMRYGAKELRAFGMKFKCSHLQKSKTCGLMDAIHEKRSVEIPPCVMESIYFLIPNLIALERCINPYEHYITFYALLLGYFITSKDDVKILRQKHILLGNRAEDEKFAAEINSLLEKVNVVYGFPYFDIIAKVEAYVQNIWHKPRPILFRWYEILKRDYFSSPWAFLSCLAAIILLVLTVIQTVLAFLSYPPKD